MSKKPTKADLQRVGVINPFYLCVKGKGNIYVAYHPAEKWHSPKWQVIRPGFKTDRDAHWSDGGCKTFSVSNRTQKEPQRLAALEWASKRYGVTEWERDPWGDYHPKGTMDAALMQSETCA